MEAATAGKTLLQWELKCILFGGEVDEELDASVMSVW